MKIAIASATIGDAFAAAVAKATLSTRSYCQKFGYDFLLCEELLDQSRPAPMSKILWISQNLPNYDAIFWIDGDALIIDQSRRIEQIIGAPLHDQTKDLVMTRDWVGNINTGVFWVRNTPWTQQLLREVYRQGIMAPISRAGGWDNTAFVQLYDSDPAVSTRTCVFNTQTLQINCYPHQGQPITRETFALHFAGVYDLEQLKRWIDHFSGDRITERIADFFWYPMFRASLLRHAPWTAELYTFILDARRPSVAAAEKFIRLAWLYHNRGAEAKATSLFERSLRVQEKFLGSDHRFIADLLELYRIHLLEYGRNAEAGALEARAKAIRAKSQ